MKAFDLADKYRNPVLILGDAMLGNMKEPITKRKYKPKTYSKDWILDGAKGRESRLLKSLYLAEGELTDYNWVLYKKYQKMKKEIRYEVLFDEDAELMVTAFGSMARILKSSVQICRDRGMKVGLFRPITLFPFPTGALSELSLRIKHFVTLEMNTGQMVEDVKMAVMPQGGSVDFYGRPPGSIPSPDELYDEIKKIYLKRIAS
jgi:2-oxoglutarate ferredoxin oxidoreductase subunit alpha